MIKTIKHAVNKYAWLFFVAAWVYTLSFIFTNYFSYSSSSAKVAGILSEYIQGRENSFKNILHDSATIAAITSDRPSSIKEQLISDAQGIFAYQVNDIGHSVEIFWNTNKMTPAESDLARPDGNYLVNYPNGIFDLVKTSFKNGKTGFFLVMMIPVRWEYFMQNEYLRSHFAINEDIDKSYEIAPVGKGAPVVNASGKTLFSIKEINQAYNDSPAGLSVLLRVAAMLFLFVFVNNIADEIAKNNNLRNALVFLMASFLVLRILIFFLPVPFNYRVMPLFNPDVYYGGPVNKSLGDLLVNVLLALWIIIFFRKRIRTNARTALRRVPLAYAVLTYSSFLLIPLISFRVAEIISGLVEHSAISFNAADFFSLSIFSFAGFIIVCVLLYIWLYLAGIFVQLAAQTKLSLFWQFIATLSISFLLISLNIFSIDAKMLLTVTAFMLTLIIFIRYNDNPSFSSLVRSPYFIIWALILTALASSLIVYQNKTTEKEKRVLLARNLQEQTDSSGAFLVRIALNNFSDAFLEKNFYRFKNESDNQYIKDSLTNKNLSAYLAKYNTRIYLYDADNQPLYNNDSTSFTVINSVLENRARPASYKGLYVYRNNQNNYNYIFYKKIKSDSALLGSLFVLIQPKLFENTSLVPELFRRTNDILSSTSNYEIGVYDNRKLVSPFTGFNFSDSVTAEQIPRAGYAFKDSLHYNQLWYNAGNGKLLVIARKNDAFFNFVTLFSYLFVLFILLSFIVHNSRYLIQNRSAKSRFRHLFRFNIRTQIQSTIIGVSFISFLVIGTGTISFFSLRFKKNTTNELINASQIIAREIQQALKFALVNTDPDIDGMNDDGEFEKKIADIAAIQNVDINLYRKDGTLSVSSQPYIYTQQILSRRIDPEAYYEMHYNQSTRFVNEEQIGNFSFQSIYTPIKGEHDETVAYLNIPSLGSQDELKDEISGFLVTLIILNALIFIFAGAVSVALTGRITSSLELIGNKMKEIKIGVANEEIPWKRNDEIGMLVKEYNKMVKQLGKSVEALAKTEREGAWREMARQVAHEIKNPLTPMKLSIQYLQRAMEENSPNAVDLSKKLASTLVEQIDQLSKIAGDFSQFANIENTKPEYFDINELLKNLVNLYKADSNLIISFTAEEDYAEVFSDKAQVNRLFTNLIKNALEAYDESEPARIQIKQYMQQSDVIVSVTDFGNGITEELRSKIFNPNFTTKSSGTGLGLAICKAIVEKAGGHIWFTTAIGEGTSFYVKLPLAHKAQPVFMQPV
ncbi:ATP-binding protein [Parafilimonas sp.]|uniref:sensor histidine kinase n=1 Tax=Parafilimonas sp. TaxID=1969739 RepID=UPI0039E501D3